MRPNQSLCAAALLIILQEPEYGNRAGPLQRSERLRVWAPSWAAYRLSSSPTHPASVQRSTGSACASFVPCSGAILAPSFRSHIAERCHFPGLWSIRAAAAELRVNDSDRFVLSSTSSTTPPTLSTGPLDISTTHCLPPTSPAIPLRPIWWPPSASFVQRRQYERDT